MSDMRNGGLITVVHVLGGINGEVMSGLFIIPQAGRLGGGGGCPGLRGMGRTTGRGPAGAPAQGCGGWRESGRGPAGAPSGHTRTLLHHLLAVDWPCGPLSLIPLPPNLIYGLPDNRHTVTITYCLSQLLLLSTWPNSM